MKSTDRDMPRDVIDNCWVGAPPVNPRIAHEVKMATFGKFDFVIADGDDSTKYNREFISVEVQAVDITGSVEPVQCDYQQRQRDGVPVLWCELGECPQALCYPAD